MNSKDVCGQDFEYLGFKLRKKKGVSVYVGEIYNPGFFYIQMASDVNNLKCFMNELQLVNILIYLLLCTPKTDYVFV